MRTFALLAALGLGLYGCSETKNWGGGPSSQDGNLRRTLELTPAGVPANLGQRAYEHCDQVVAFGPRHVGSKGWRLALVYIRQQLRKLGLKPVSDQWANSIEKLTFENIHVTIPGQVKDRIVIGCHHDTKCTENHQNPKHNFPFVGANDSGSGVGLMLALAEVLAKRKNHATIQLVFFDGEESIPYVWKDERALFGSTRFVKKYMDRKLTGASGESTIRAFMLLDMVGAKDLQIDEVTNSNSTMRDIVYAAARATGHAKLFFRHKGGVTDDHVPFHKERIPCVNLIDLNNNPQWHTKDDTMDHISAKSLHTIGEVVLTALPEIERRFVKDKAPVRLR